MKKYFNRFLLVVGLLSLTVLTTACANNGAGGMNPPSGGPYGFIYQILGVPFQNLILSASNTIGGQNGYAWGIIIISFVVRLLLLPLSLIQQKKSIVQQEKMKGIQPQLKIIQEQQKKAATREEQAQVSQLMMQVYSKNNIKLTGGIGCLPLLLQFPVFIAIYQAVQYSPEISKASFLGAPLAKPSIVITIIATLFYVVQSFMALKNLPKEQKQQMQMMLFMSPAMTLFISIASSAALALYFLIGGVIIVIQQIISDYIITPKVRAQVDKELSENPIVEVVTKDTFKQQKNMDAAKKEAPAKQQNRNRQRNAGKQNRHN